MDICGPYNENSKTAGRGFESLRTCPGTLVAVKELLGALTFIVGAAVVTLGALSTPARETAAGHPPSAQTAPTRAPASANPAAKH